jgi:ribosomal protein S18 acetylase RimI-like enzyme
MFGYHEKPRGGNEVPDGSEALPASVIVRPYLPSDLDDKTVERLDLHNLVRQGAAIPEKDIPGFTSLLFKNDKPPTRVTYIAEAEDKAVGFVVLNTLPLHQPDPLGVAFLSWMDIYNPMFSQALQKSRSTIAHIHGMGTDSECSGQGVQRRLWQHVATDIRPDIFLSESKNPAAVTAIAAATGPLGYKTYFGLTEVTPNADPNISTPEVIGDIIDTDVSLFGGESGLIFAPRTHFPAQTPDVRNFPPVIRGAFERVTAAQSLAQPEIIVVQPLISIRNTLLASPPRRRWRR